jgi:hypothetical protein
MALFLFISCKVLKLRVELVYSNMEKIFLFKGRKSET